ncbi:hypothetical protein GQ457_04G004940 [Hibiscus cannabinus]
MGSGENCGLAEEKVEERHGEENSDMGGAKAREMEGKEGGIEGKETKTGDLEGDDALSKANKREREEEPTFPWKRGKTEGAEEGKSSDFAAGKEGEESGVQLKGEERLTCVEIQETPNAEDIANSGDDSKRILRAIAEKVSYGDVEEHDVEEFVPKKRGRGRPKKEAAKSEGQEDVFNENGDNSVHAQKRGRGRPRKQAFESQGNAGKDVDNRKSRGRGRGRPRKQASESGGIGGEDVEVLRNGPLGMNESEDLVFLREEEPVPGLKKKRDSSWITVAKEDRVTCHQCKRNDKGRVVRCQLCKAKRYCIPCITNWYPKMSEDEIADACPVCRRIAIARHACG